MLLRNRLLPATCSLLVLCLPYGTAQGEDKAPGIFMCTDARGRTLTADRPIPDCADRQQREFSPSGNLRRTLDPEYTPREQAERDARAREAAVQAGRMNDERRRERALLMRYPTAAAHDRERTEAMRQVDGLVETARKRLDELAKERQPLVGELEFYRKDPSRVPALLRQKLQDNDESVAVQNRFIAGQEEERRRIAARFDEERVRLDALWASTGAQRSPINRPDGTSTVR
ncbi:DUF4124 domain-containing protein [Variovorax sp. RHLX14]|uniref:DUF4124 domain-containing protein n=1 Tax=Variovorax sp. RHLX14 TaxID=1259731 RepID=UPI003F475A9C